MMIFNNLSFLNIKLLYLDVMQEQVHIEQARDTTPFEWKTLLMQRVEASG